MRHAYKGEQEKINDDGPKKKGFTIGSARSI